jgi:hypothetical protein
LHMSERNTFAGCQSLMAREGSGQDFKHAV